MDQAAEFLPAQAAPRDAPADAPLAADQLPLHDPAAIDVAALSVSQLDQLRGALEDELLRVEHAKAEAGAEAGAAFAARDLAGIERAWAREHDLDDRRAALRDARERARAALYGQLDVEAAAWTDDFQRLRATWRTEREQHRGAGHALANTLASWIGDLGRLRQERHAERAQLGARLDALRALAPADWTGTPAADWDAAEADAVALELQSAETMRQLAALLSDAERSDAPPPPPPAQLDQPDVGLTTFAAGLLSVSGLVLLGLALWTDRHYGLLRVRRPR
jgi:hypothetical protein